MNEKTKKEVKKILNTFKASPYFNEEWDKQYKMLEKQITESFISKKELEGVLEGMKHTMSTCTCEEMGCCFNKALQDYKKQIEETLEFIKKDV